MYASMQVYSVFEASGKGIPDLKAASTAVLEGWGGVTGAGAAEAAEAEAEAEAGAGAWRALAEALETPSRSGAGSLEAVVVVEGPRSICKSTSSSSWASSAAEAEARWP